MEVPLIEDNAPAMLTILAIVHGLTRRVPRKVDKNLLVQVAISIDKYEFHEIAEVYTDMWFQDLK